MTMHESEFMNDLRSHEEKFIKPLSELSEKSEQSNQPAEFKGKNNSWVNSKKGELSEQRIDDRDYENWPELPKEALYGFAGDFVRTATKNSEADPAAVLLTFLSRFGIECGTTPFFRVGDSKHNPRIFVVIVGASSKARKGTSGNPVKKLFNLNVENTARCTPGPLSSGEGLTHAVRDEIQSWVVNKRTGQGEWIVTDPGVNDKRLFILDEEFAGALSCTKREGNTLSTIIRCAWDSGDIEILTKSNQTKSTGAHIGIVSHITIAELDKKLGETEAFNGFANRFLWGCARRQRLVPFPEPMPGIELNNLQSKLSSILLSINSIAEMSLSDATRALWKAEYPELSSDRNGLMGAVTNRAEAQVIRLSMIYALLDGQQCIERHHLEAAISLWWYCEDSARFIFSGRGSSQYAKKIFDLIQSDGPKAATEIYNHFNRHISKAQFENAIKELIAQKKITINKVQTRGRPKQLFTVIT